MKPKETHKQDLQGKKGGTREGRGERKGKEKKIIPQKNHCFVVREILESPTQTSIQASVLIVGLPLSVDKSLTSFRGHNPLNTKSTLQFGKKRNKSKAI